MVPMARRSDISKANNHTDEKDIDHSFQKLLDQFYIDKLIPERIVVGSSAPAVNKGSGLKKWKRVSRDVVKKTGSELSSSENSDRSVSVSPVLKDEVSVDEVSSLNGGNSVLCDDQGRSSRDGPGKKARGVIDEKENSVGSDTGSSKFVFLQGSNIVAKYDDEVSDDAHYADKELDEEVRIASESDDVSLASDYIEKDEGSVDNDHTQDQLVESVKGLHLAQDEFEKEVQNWRDVGKDDDGPLHDILEEKDSKILELETILNSGDIKTKLEDRLMKLIQTEVEYVVLRTTTELLRDGPLCEIKHDDLQQKNVSSQEKQDEKLQPKEDLKKLQNKVYRFTSSFIIMLILLLVTLYLQLSPQNVEVVPT